MGDEYQALARAIRRPMRRWWLRVGSWWIGATAVPLCALAWLTWDQYGASFLGAGARPGVMSEQAGYLLALDAILVALATATWFMHSLNVNSLVSGLVKDTTSASDQALRQWRFRLGVLGGVAPIGLMLLAEYLQMLPYVAQSQDEVNVTALTWLGPLAMVHRFAFAAAVMLWVTCLVTFAAGGRVAAFLWYLGFIVFPSIGWILLAFLDVSSVRLAGVRSHRIDLSSMTESLLIILMLAAAYGVVLMMAKGFGRWGITLSACVAAAMAAVGLHVMTGSAILDTLVYAAGWLAYKAPFALSLVYWAETGKLQLWLCEFRIEVAWPSALGFVAFFGWFAVLAGHYFAISWILRNVKPRRA